MEMVIIKLESLILTTATYCRENFANGTPIRKIKWLYQVFDIISNLNLWYEIVYILIDSRKCIGKGNILQR